MLKTLICLYFIIGQSFAQNYSSLTFSQIVDTPDQEIGVKILEKVYSKLNIKINFIKVTGVRALLESRAGNTDGEVHRILKIGELYPSLLRVPTPINYIEPNIFSIKKYTITKCSELKDLRVGIVSGVKHAEICTRDLKKVKVLKHSLELIRALNEREVDVILTARLNGMIQIEKLGYNKVKILNPPISKKHPYHYVHKKHKSLIPKIDAIIKKMIISGELKALRKKLIKKVQTQAKQF